MNISEDQTIEKSGKTAVVVIEIFYFHTNMNILAFQVVTT